MCILCILFFGCAYFLFAGGRSVDIYYVINNSGENIRVTVKFKDSLRANSGGVDYYKNGTLVAILRHTYGIPYDIEKYELPFYTGWTDNIIGNRPFYNRLEAIYLNPVAVASEWDENGNPKASERIRIPDFEIYHLFLEMFIIYDMADNIVFTLDDLDESSFRDDYVISTPGDREPRWLIYGLFITREMVEAGRAKYAGLVLPDLRLNIYVPPQ
jgi:hypothetical protein